MLFNIAANYRKTCHTVQRMDSLPNNMDVTIDVDGPDGPLKPMVVYCKKINTNVTITSLKIAKENIRKNSSLDFM